MNFKHITKVGIFTIEKASSWKITSQPVYVVEIRKGITLLHFHVRDAMKHVFIAENA